MYYLVIVSIFIIGIIAINTSTTIAPMLQFLGVEKQIQI